MRRKLFLVILVMALPMMACSLTAPRPAAVQSTPVTAVQVPTLALPQAPTGTATASAAETPTQAATVAQTGGQPVDVRGSFTFTNEIILTYYVENAVSLTDMYGFVKRDKQWEIPVSSQTLGYMTIDAEKKTGTFNIDLPAQPTGKLVDVNPDNKAETGVQIFAAEYLPNLTGSPFAVGDDVERGWPSFLASVKTDSENGDEVTGGKLVIWSPDGTQKFPSGFGTDGLLFSADDPVMPVPQGYSVIDLDKTPFAITRDAQAELTLYEPNDVAIKDYSKLSYAEAFDKMFAAVRKEYAFNGVEGKQPDWDKVYASLKPRVDAAAQKKDARAFYQVMHDFTMEFKDGHVGLSGDEASKAYREQYAGGYGFAILPLDDGRIMVTHIVQGESAEKAGMKVGAVITQFNGKPIDQALKEVPLPGPDSTESAQRVNQARYLVRAPVGTKVEVTFTNTESGSAAAPKTAELVATNETESFTVTNPFRDADPNGLPVEYQVATNEIGYVRINSSYDDLNLIIRLFQRALNKFKENNLTSLVIDLRANSGGANLALAGFLTDKEIPLGQLQYYSDKTGKFEPEREADKVTPNQEQYRFDKIFVLVGQGCASACELEAYGFSQLPGAVVVGQYPTSGTEAEVSRGQFKLPEGLTLQVPTGRFVLPDGSIFLEGKGVQPTERIPVDEKTALSARDPVLQRVLQLIQGQ